MTPVQARNADATGPASAAAAADKASSAAPPVDESEWAAFEADIAAAEAPYDEGAVISAPAMTAEEAAAKDAADGENGSHKAQVDVDIEDEKEEATRALEDEFAEMKELEARVKSLKEQRQEILKKRRESQSQGHDSAPAKAPLAANQNSVDEAVAQDDQEDDDDDDEEEEDDDDWDGFRFRT
jgi:zinc finger protein 830